MKRVKHNVSMNKRRLAYIARWLEAGAPERKYVKEFNMLDGIVVRELKETGEQTLKCGTICCLAGAAVCFFNEPAALIQEKIDASYNDPAWAARVIRRLIATGVVDWPGCKDG